MNIAEKIDELREGISHVLLERISSNYWLLEVPFYSNIGDTLIWQGEMDFLKGTGYRCKGMHSLETFRFSHISPNDLILFQGGGNFGDLWVRHHEFKMRVVEAYPNNEFLFLPQTVYFENPRNMRECASLLAGKKATICARDNASYKTLKENFNNEVLLVPDMAFCIDMRKWRSSVVPTTDRHLLLKREDKELKMSEELIRLEAMEEFDTSDWSTFRGDNAVEVQFNRLRRVVGKPLVRRIPGLESFALGMYMLYKYRPFLISSGITQLSRYSEIYTTRLHAGILGMLLNKRVRFLDNSYGKNRHFYETWLSDCEDVEFM